MKFKLTLIGILLSLNSYCQPFEKIYTPGFATSMLQRSDSSFVLSISQVNHGLFKIRENGDSIRYSPFQFCTIRKIITSLPGGFLAIGSNIHAGSSSDAFIMRLNTFLDTIWLKEFVSLGFYSTGEEIIELPDSSIVLGIVGNAGMSHIGFRLLHLDKNGNILWNKNFNTWSNSVVYNLAYKDSFVYTAINEEYDHLQLNCYNLYTGDTAWEKDYYRYSSNSNTVRHWTNSIVVNDSGIFIAGCDVVDSSSFNINRQTIFRTNLIGDSVSLNVYGSGQLTKIIMDSDNNFSCIGINEGDSVSLMKFDFALNPIWTKKFQRFDRCLVYELISTLDGGYAFCGEAVDTLNNINYTYVVRTDSGAGAITTIIPVENFPVRYFYDYKLKQIRITFENEVIHESEAVIYSVNGNLLFKKDLTEITNTIDMSKLASGFYVVVIKNNHRIVSTQKNFVY